MILQSLFRFASRPLALGLALAALGSTPAWAATDVTCSPNCQGTWTLGMTGVNPSCTFTWSTGTSSASAIDLGRYPTAGLGKLGMNLTSGKPVSYSLSVSNCSTPLSQIAVTFTGAYYGTTKKFFLLGPSSNGLAFEICRGAAVSACNTASNEFSSGVPMTLVDNPTPVVPNGKVADFTSVAFCTTSACNYVDTGTSGVTAPLTVVTSYN
jgi:hypothetical protein